MSNGSSTVVAAGALCWRTVDGVIEILLVHREERADISLPKGKLNRGETAPQAAVREVAEETGYAITLGAPLGTIDYRLGGGKKKLVYYWVAEVDDTTVVAPFTANNEIAKLEWLPLTEAKAKLSYDRDRDVLDRFSARVASNAARTFSLILVRHAKPVPLDSWDGPDQTRPLLHRGIQQARSIAPAIAAFNPLKLLSSTASRCLDTLEPLADMLGLAVKETSILSQDAYLGADDLVGKLVAKRISKRKTTVLCSHSPILPVIIEQLARLTNTPMSNSLQLASRLSTGNYTVVHLATENPEQAIIAIETHGPTES